MPCAFDVPCGCACGLWLSKTTCSLLQTQPQEQSPGVILGPFSRHRKMARSGCYGRWDSSCGPKSHVFSLSPGVFLFVTGAFCNQPAFMQMGSSSDVMISSIFFLIFHHMLSRMVKNNYFTYLTTVLLEVNKRRNSFFFFRPQEVDNCLWQSSCWESSSVR